MVLQQLQGLLARLYDVPSSYAVADFLITDRKQLDALGWEGAERDATDEQVLVSESNGRLRLSVYVADDVLSRLAANNPVEALGENNLSDFCTAIEGVSHFHYLTWRATHAEPVSLLELELQAEVDKYAAAMCLFTEQYNGRYPSTLHERLFHRVCYFAGLSAECLARYREANRFAARFCRQLDERFLRPRRVHAEGWLRELRTFYRLRHAQKLQRACA